MAEQGDTRATRDRFQALAGDPDVDRPGVRTVVTTDPEAIRQWAARHNAEPATGEATRSGAAARHVVDGGAGIRFNFPGSSAFRPISWDEWLEHFDAHDLAFVYEVEDQSQIRVLAPPLAVTGRPGEQRLGRLVCGRAQAAGRLRRTAGVPVPPDQAPPLRVVLRGTTGRPARAARAARVAHGGVDRAV
jgi:hypothetical protein